jgi:chaperonin GroES
MSSCPTALQKSDFPACITAPAPYKSFTLFLLSPPFLPTTTPKQSLRKLIPLADRILVQRILPKTQTAGGVFLPETKLDKPNEGKVIAVGPGGRKADGSLIPPSVKEGDTVLLPEYGGHTVKLGEDEYQLFRDEDLLGKFT